MKKAKTLFALAISTMAIASCSTQKATTAQDITGQWTIECAMNTTTETADTTPFINFGKDGNVNGNASVNLFHGSYTLKGDKLSFSNVGITQMLGQSMNVESAITEALNNATSIKAEDNTAYMFDSNNDTIMVLKK